MSFDWSSFSADARRIAHRAGRADGDAERDAAWIAYLNSQRSGPGIVYVQDNVPDGSPLSGANMIAAVQASVAVAQAAGLEVVQIPVGDWYLTADDLEVLIPASDSRQTGITICGAGYEKTQLIYPVGFTGTAFFFKGSPPQSSQYMIGGGMRDMTLSVAAEDVSTTGIGVRVEGCVNTLFSHLTIRNFTGGVGFQSTRAEPDFTNQYVQFYRVTVAGCDVNYDLTSLVNSQAYGLYSGSARTRDFIIDDVKFSIYGGYMQSSCDVGVEFEAGADGGCRFVMYDIYWEGINAARIQFKFGAPAQTFNVFEVHGFQNGGAPATFCDVDSVFNSVVLENIYAIGNCGTYVKARNGASVQIINSGDPVADSGKFDLDSLSLSKLIAINAGATYVGTKHRAVDGFTLPSYAENSEPASPVAGDLIASSTSVRPRFRGTSAWKDLAFSDDPNDLTSILEPYAAEIFDPGVLRTQTLVSGDLDTLVGLLNGTTAIAPAAGQRPTWTASDSYFGGKPSFTCALSGNHFLSGSLASSIASGSYAGLFVVYRVPGGTNDPSNRRQVAVIEHVADHSSAVSVGQSDLNQSNKVYFYASGTFVSLFATGATGTDSWGHVAIGFNDDVGHLAHITRDVEADGPGLIPGPSSSVIDTIHLGAAFDGVNYLGCDITIAYCAVLSSTPPAAARSKAIRAAFAKYSLR